MSRRAEVVLVLLAFVACRTEPKPSPEPTRAPPAPSPPAAVGAIDAAAIDASGEREDAGHAEDPGSLLTAAAKTGRSLGHTSVVFRLTLGSGEKAIWKPASKRGPLRYKGEIAAYRFSIALGVPNVPAAYFRTFPYAEVATALSGIEVFQEVLVRDGAARGAIMPWIEKLEFLPLESEPLYGKWRKALRRAEPMDDPAFARQTSTLAAFDWMTGNWDRWSGGNVGIDKERNRLLFIDNDGAFFEKPPQDALAKSRRLLLGIERFSRSFVERSRALDREALARAIGDETPGTPLLSRAALDGVDERRRVFLAHVDALLADAGAADVLVFP